VPVTRGGAAPAGGNVPDPDIRVGCCISFSTTAAIQMPLQKPEPPTNVTERTFARRDVSIFSRQDDVQNIGFSAL